MNLEPVLTAMRTAIDAAQFAPGVYTRWLGSERNQRLDGMCVNPYGSADAADALYTLDQFPRDLTERAAFVTTLQAINERHAAQARTGSPPLHLT